MVKYRPLKENIFREYFSYLVDPILNFSKFTESKYAHRYRTGKPSNVASYFNRFISDNKVRSVYKELDYLYYSSKEDLKQQKEQGLVASNMHPIDEQNWFIDYLKPRIEVFSAEDIWRVMQDMGLRDKYSKFISKTCCISQFEIFIQNYFFSALPPSKLIEIFLLTLQSKEDLGKFIDHLCCKQAIRLIKTLKKITLNQAIWDSYCQNLLCVMRNAQIKEVFLMLPIDLQEEALKKLYPYEMIEVVEKINPCEEKEKLIAKILKNGLLWWSHFSHEEVKQAFVILRSL